MLYPDDFERLSALSERLARWVRQWAHRWRVTRRFLQSIESVGTQLRAIGGVAMVDLVAPPSLMLLTQFIVSHDDEVPGREAVITGRADLCDARQ